MIRFNLKDRDDKTKVRTGVFKGRTGNFSTPQRALVSTEVNYKPAVEALLEGNNKISYPNKFFVAQLRIDANCVQTRDVHNYAATLHQAQKYMPSNTDKICVLKPLFGVFVRVRKEDGTYKKRFIPINQSSLNPKPEDVQKLVRDAVQLADDADYDGVILPYPHQVFQLSKFKSIVKEGHTYAEKMLASDISIIPELPHTDNVNDFEKALADYADEQQEGLISIPNAGKVFRYTHEAVKEFSESDKSEKIGLIATNLPRRTRARKGSVSYAHYALLKGYDFPVRKIPYAPFLRENGLGAHQLPPEVLRRFNRWELSIRPFDKGLFFDNSPVDTTCSAFANQDNQTLFRQARQKEVLDKVLKVLETFDSHNEMQECQPYIASNDFKAYLGIRSSLKEAYDSEFDAINKQSGLGRFFG